MLILGNEKDLNNEFYLLILIVLITIIGGVFMVNIEYLFMGIAELVVSGLLYATSTRTTSGRIKMFMYVGMAVLIMLAGFQFIRAFA